MQLLDLFIMRWPNTDAIKFRWALGPFFRLSNRDQSATWTGRVATRTRGGPFVSQNPGSGSGRTDAASHLVRLHLVAIDAGKLADLSAHRYLPVSPRMVPEVE